MSILLSVVIPMYNGSKYIQDSLNSLLKQTYKDFEIIVVDDGSSDSSVQIVDEYSQRNNEIYIIKQDHKGISAAIENGISHANSRYIVLMDQDDVAYPWRLEKTAKAFNEGAEFIIGQYDIVDDDLNLTGRTVKVPSYVNENNILLEQLKRTYVLGSCMAFYHKGDIAFNPETGGVTDYDICLKMLMAEYSFCYLPISLIKYRVHQSNTSSNYSNQKQDVQTMFEAYQVEALWKSLLDKGYQATEVNLALGICYLFQDRLNIAKPFFDHCEIDELNDFRLLQEFLFYYSIINLELKRFSEFESNLNILIENDNTDINPAVYNNLAVLLAKKGEINKAKSLLGMAIQKNFQYQDAKNNMLILLKGNLKELVITKRLLREVITHQSIKH